MNKTTIVPVRRVQSYRNRPVTWDMSQEEAIIFQQLLDQPTEILKGKGGSK